MIAHEVEPAIRSMIETRNFAGLRDMFKEWSLVDVADLITKLPEDEQVLVFRFLPHDLAADTFAYLHIYAQRKLLKAMAREDVANIINEMPADDRTKLLE